ncbi:MAG: hypothetical protein ABMA64_37805 [Myxococcota bacterium]
MNLDELLSWSRQAREKYGTVTVGSLQQVTLGDIAAELATEQATTLGTLGARLDRAVAELAAAEGDPERHARACAAFETARWEMLVVKEAMGLRGVRAQLDRDYPLRLMRSRSGARSG